MGFLIIFVIAVVIIGSIVITLNIRAIRMEAEAENRSRWAAGGQSGADAGSVTPARATEPEPASHAEAVRQKRPFAGAAAGSPPAPPASARPADDDPLPWVPGTEKHERQMSDDEYRAAIRAMATGQPPATAQTRAEAAAGESDDAAYRAGLRSLSGLDSEKEP